MIVVAAAVTNLQPDNSHLQPMLDQTLDNCGALPGIALGDAGYWKPDNAVAAERLGVDHISHPSHMSRRSAGNTGPLRPPVPSPTLSPTMMVMVTRERR